MVLIIHIAIALFSIGYATFLFFHPTQTRINATYGLITLTLGSGTYLIWNTGAHILQGCIMGLTYLAGVSAAVILAKRKLAADSKISE
ncbi:MAG TPA: hypothetical protein VFX86_01120 [Candidatus Saccharimonadales bacterium]|nr:hypothetical protein [Candidatus Saccharimonadales bacterium]